MVFINAGKWLSSTDFLDTVGSKEYSPWNYPVKIYFLHSTKPVLTTYKNKFL
jgi:hypothetical protein